MKNEFVFLKTAEAILEKIFKQLNELKSVNFNHLDKDKTVLVMIDMVNGFVKKGALQSQRIASIVPEVVKLSYKCEELSIKKLVFADCHNKDSREFKSFPPHCVEGTNEKEVIEELKSIGGYKLIEKNSTNGFIEPSFQKWLKENETIDTFIVVGDCTDICVLQFVLSLKTHFNRLNQDSRIIVPMNGVNTYDHDTHDGDLMHVFGLYNMIMNDIEVVKEIV